MSFGAPEWLWGEALLPLLALGFWIAAWHRRRRWRRLATPRAQARISLLREGRRPLLRALLLLAAAGMIFLALSRPRWGEWEEEVHAQGLDLIVALDLSRSMLAEDLAPSRLTVARSIARQLAAELASDRVGLIGFAGQAGLLCPLTLDRGSLDLYLAAADPGIFPQQGTNIAAAISLADDLFRRRAQARKVLVILSDGEDQQPGALAAAARAREAGVTIYAIGTGTPGGAPIPLRDAQGRITGYKQDQGGNIVTTRLDEESLGALARAAGGAYVRASGFGQGVEKVVEAISGMQRSDLADTLPLRQAERYRWPLGAAFLLIAIEAALVDRRRRQ